MNAIANDPAALVWSQFWQISILIVAVAGLNAVLLKRRPHLMHIAWVIVFIKCLTLPVWSSPVGIFSVLQPAPSAETAQSLWSTGLRPNSWWTDEVSESHIGVVAADQTTPPPVISRSGWPLLAVTTWLVVAALLAGSLMYRWWHVAARIRREQNGRIPDAAERLLQQRLQQMRDELQMRRAARLHVSDANIGPMVFGFLRPVIILPRVLVRAKSAAELEPALMHELLHIRRGDSLFSLLQVVAQIVWWFHPLVWWANRSANQVCERCCDEEAVANLRCRPVDYARCLVDALEIRAQTESIPAAPGIRPVDITSLRLQHILRNAGRFRDRMPRVYSVLAVALAFIVLPGAAHISAPDSGTVRQLTDVQLGQPPHLDSPEWEQAVAKYRALTSKDANDARAWFMLGYTLHMNGRLEEAIVAHRRAAEFPATRRTALYNLGCAYALQGESSAALRALQQAVDAGFISRTPIEEDPDLLTLQGLPEFERIAEAVRPSADRDVYRQLDFWIGKWHVYDGDGQKIGSHVITRDANGFLIVERWEERTGGTGTSIRFYDPASQSWKQTSVDTTGKVIQYQGRIGQSRVTFEGQETDPHGRVVRSRVFYRRHNDGSVRQLIEQSYDDGKSWQKSFEGRYVRQSGTTTIKASVTAS